jgi:hypothetical protein
MPVGSLGSMLHVTVLQRRQRATMRDMEGPSWISNASRTAAKGSALIADLPDSVTAMVIGSSLFVLPFGCDRQAPSFPSGVPSRGRRPELVRSAFGLIDQRPGAVEVAGADGVRRSAADRLKEVGKGTREPRPTGAPKRRENLCVPCARCVLRERGRAQNV